MEYISILNQEEYSYDEIRQPDFFTDLNLGQIVDKITLDWDGPVDKFYYGLPKGQVGEKYRRDVFRDMKQEGLQEILTAYLEQMKQREEVLDLKDRVEDKYQMFFLHIRELSIYCQALEALKEGMDSHTFTSEGMQKFQKYLKEYLAKQEYIEMRDKVRQAIEEVKGFRVCLTYDKDFLQVTDGNDDCSYDTYLEKCFPGHGKVFRSPFWSSEELTDLEAEILKVFRKKHKKFFKDADQLCNDHEEYCDPVFVRFCKEIPYYLSFLTFEKSMKEQGYCFSEPKVEDVKQLKADGLYDLALACVNLGTDREVVSNEIAYEDGESFLVVTGPNQGGKTTFARSLGQLVYFTKMGLDVPAETASVPYYSCILTHFSVEESVETGRGKLMEELTRLVPMMKQDVENAFVVINELFTTAANYDACIMGRKVLEHFIARKCKGIYVTHLHELTKAHEAVVSLSAMVDEQNKQTFKVRRSEALEIASAANQVQKYKLTYEQIKERFS